MRSWALKRLIIFLSLSLPTFSLSIGSKEEKNNEGEDNYEKKNSF